MKAASVFSNAYILALPTELPAGVGLLPLPFLWDLKEIVEFARLLFNPNTGVPWTLFNLNKVPSLKLTLASLNSSLSLGLSTSMTDVPDFSISWPLTYAFPGDTFTHIKGSSGVFLWSVFSFDKYTPSFDTPSFKHSATSTLKLPTE